MRKLILSLAVLGTLPVSATVAQAQTCIEDSRGRIICGRSVRPYYNQPRYSYGPRYEDYGYRSYSSGRRGGAVIGYGPAVGCPPGQVRLSDRGNGQCYPR